MGKDGMVVSKTRNFQGEVLGGPCEGFKPKSDKFFINSYKRESEIASRIGKQIVVSEKSFLDTE